MDPFSIGICAEDAEAARVVAAALDAGCRPFFYNARGTFVDMRFVRPRRPTEHVASGESFPLLYGWIERVSADTLVQLVEPTPPARRPFWFVGGVGAELHESQTRAPTSSNDAGDFSTSSETGGRESAGRVVGSLSFLLHVVSTPAQEHAHDIVLPDSVQVDEETHRGDLPDAVHTTHSTKGRLLPSPRGEPLKNALEEEQAAMDRRDDRQVVRNAVETVLNYSQLITEHPGSSGSVYVNESTGWEYIKFE
ncbi:unnamed protein product [Phytomonas sp. EM1]|nr:unnamed protein product [Phytomonas sp. EM1]|eukprot:CCW61176.1 unnamed protein product [Phytomonas sp. isolate EM1]